LFGQPLARNQWTDVLTLTFNIKKLDTVIPGVTYNDIKALVSGQLSAAPAAAAKPGAAGAAGGAGQPGGAGASGGGKRVSIRLDDFFPDEYAAPNPVAADIQNLLRLQYLSGLRNPGAGP
jgi:hypothetical protein